MDLKPMSDWEGAKSDPLLIWRTRVDERFLVEVQGVPLSNMATFCVFDHEHGLECVRHLTVHTLPFEDGKPAREDVDDWAHKIRVFLESARQYA